MALPYLKIAPNGTPKCAIRCKTFVYKTAVLHFPCAVSLASKAALDARFRGPSIRSRFSDCCKSFLMARRALRFPPSHTLEG